MIQQHPRRKKKKEDQRKTLVDVQEGDFNNKEPRNAYAGNSGCKRAGWQGRKGWSEAGAAAVDHLRK